VQRAAANSLATKKADFAAAAELAQAAAIAAWNASETLYRFLHAGTANAFAPKNPMSAEQIIAWARKINGNITARDAILLMAEHHAQNMLGTDNAESPFVSMTRDPAKAAGAGTIAAIVSGAPDIWEFRVPRRYIVPLGNKVSKGEAEVLVWLPPGKTLKNISQFDHVTHENTWKKPPGSGGAAAAVGTATTSTAAAASKQNK
jgi:hypothetical protein